MITVYHGGVTKVEKPLVHVGRSNLDFGRGFYLTRIKQQAEEWALRASRKMLLQPVVNQYELDMDTVASAYRLLTFEKYDSEWLHFIVSCRNGYDPAVSYDCIEGGVANDRVVDTIEGFINGTVDEVHALAELAKHQPNNQICILNQDVIHNCLKFIKTL
ncbi:MAG: DUF3990 domain-containing protein [Bacteroidaceae bacterium]|nr:DUF3990 domain-containing protein [Bacteroidaceae bacterium]